MKYKLIIFDLDGTILNTLDDLASSCNAVLVKNNMPVHTKDEIRMFVGNGIRKLIERAVPEESDEETKNKVLSDFTLYYKEHSLDKTKPYDGITELFSELKTRGIKIAVNTNKNEDVSKEICENFFPGFVDIVAGGNAGRPVKPDSAGVKLILSSLEISKEKTLFVGDSDVDYQTGINAGIDVVNVSWGFRDEKFLREHGAIKIVHNPEELLKIIFNS